MPQARASITIIGDPNRIFDETNDVSRWPELFQGYTQATVISRVDAGPLTRLELQQSAASGDAWQSLRLLDRERGRVIAVRVAPLFPFVYVHVTWTYEPVDGGVRMTWTQDFETDPAGPHTDEQVLELITSNMRRNQIHVKRVLEGDLDKAAGPAPEVSRSGPT
jgi:aromatase